MKKSSFPLKEKKKTGENSKDWKRGRKLRYTLHDSMVVSTENCIHERDWQSFMTVFAQVSQRQEHNSMSTTQKVFYLKKEDLFACKVKQLTSLYCFVVFTVLARLQESMYCYRRLWVWRKISMWGAGMRYTQRNKTCSKDIKTFSFNSSTTVLFYSRTEI